MHKTIRNKRVICENGLAAWIARPDPFVSMHESLTIVLENDQTSPFDLYPPPVPSQAQSDPQYVEPFRHVILKEYRSELDFCVSVVSTRIDAPLQIDRPPFTRDGITFS